VKRRDLLKSIPFAASVISLPVTSSTAQAASLPEMAVIPLDTYEAIIAWQTAHRASVRAANAYSDQLRLAGDYCRRTGKWTRPVDAKACTARWKEQSEAAKLAAIARERMIFALLKMGSAQ
tara:strand:+ start:322 stop:684 length:363 start_codon:yes stop_codon:yes gene_type:complete